MGATLVCEYEGAHTGSYRANFRSATLQSLQFLTIDPVTDSFSHVTVESLRHLPTMLEGQSCDLIWTDCKNCTSLGGYCGTPSGQLGVIGGHVAKVYCGAANCP